MASGSEQISKKNRVILASANIKKIEELSVLLGNTVHLSGMQELGIISPPETGLTFVENALIKARHASKESNMPAIADDSGLEVYTLNGAPGIYSSRYAGNSATDAENIARLLHEIGDNNHRKARFVCVMVYLRHAEDPVPLIAQGFWDGHITQEAAGDSGFGYDPVFYVPERNCTAAQLTSGDKNSLSHRYKAATRLAALLNSPAP
ncbi:MAG: RdgB/HAM1 family non-canonical purine NTP pyrophosphatase [Gammaproteobacteria bacterium]|nr:RdgB/HAM1 family non-canonical purine NTP pyrophosphatase [Gammaproteobacteria bacterium]